MKIKRKIKTPEEQLAARKLAQKKYRAKNLASARKRLIKFRAKMTPEQKAYYKKKLAEYDARCYKENPDKVRMIKKTWWVKKSKEEQKAIRKAYYEACNKKNLAVYNHNYRARLKKASGSFTMEDIRELFFKQKGKCAWCLQSFGDETPNVDHYIPLAKGGSNDKKNLRLLHKSCNLQKSSIDPIEFGLRNGTLAW